MSKKEPSPQKIGFLMFLSAFLLGLVIFFVFGWLAGLFSPHKRIIDLLIGSPAGWLAVFGATLFIFSPIIGLTVWAVDRAFRSVAEQNKKSQ